MKLFNSLNKNYILFLIITVFLLTPALLLNNILFPGDEINVSGYNFKTLDKCIDKNNFELSNNLTNISNINYVDIYIFPEYDNVQCFGKVVKTYISTDGEVEVLIGYNLKVFNYLNQIYLLALFVLYLVIFRNKKKINSFLLTFIFFDLAFYYFFIFNYTKQLELDKTYRIHIFLFFYLIYFLFKENNQKSYLLVFYFCLVFSYDHLFLFVILYFLVNKNFNFDSKYKNLIILMPIFQYFLRSIAGLFEKFNYLWLSLGQSIYVGKSRYFDSQWNIFSLKCNFNPNALDERIFFSDSSRSCPSDFYGPLSDILKLNSNIYITTNLLVIFSSIVLLFIYLKLCKEFPNQIFILSLFMISNPMNFLFHQGNFDIIAIPVVFFSVILFNSKPVISSTLLFMISIIEIHPIFIFLSFIFISINRKKFLNAFFNLFLFIVGLYFIWNDDSKLSVRNQYLSGSSYDSEYLDTRVTYGITTDFSFLKNYFDSFSVIIISVIFFIFLIIYSELNAKKNGNVNFLSSLSTNHFNVFISYFVWFSSGIFLDNNVYRLHVALPVLFFLFIKSSKYIRLLVLLALLLNPVTSVLGPFSQYLLILINRFSLYFVYTKIFLEFYKYLKQKYSVKV